MTEEELKIIEDVPIPYTYMKLRHYNNHTWEILNDRDIPETSGSCDMTQEEALLQNMRRKR